MRIYVYKDEKMKKTKIKNTNHQLGFSCGEIIVDNDILMDSTRKHSKRIYLPMRIAAAFFAVFCTVMLAESFVETGVWTNVLLFYSLAATVIFGMIKSKNSTLKIVGLIGAAVIILYNIVMADEIKQGFFVIAKNYLAKANQPDSVFGVYLKYVPEEHYRQLASAFYSAFTAVIGFLTTAACVYRIDFPLLFICTFPVFELGMYWGWEGSTPAVIGLIICWFLILSMQIINHSTNKAGRKNTFAANEKKKTFYFTSSEKKAEFYPVLMRFVALLTACIFIVIMIFSAVTGFTRPEKFNVLRKQISTTVSDFTLSNLDNVFSGNDSGKNLFGVKSVGGTNGGILGETEGISFNGSTAIEIETPEFIFPMYLKGYVAGKYSDNTWTPVDVDKNEKFIQYFSEENRWVQDLNYEIQEAASNPTVNDNLSEMNITIKGASKKFAYAPYNTLYSQCKELNPTVESYVKPNKSKYSVKFFNVNTNYLDIPEQENYGIYDIYNSDYTDFVNQNYLDVQNSKALENAYNEIINQYLYTNDDDEYKEYYSYAAVCNAIRDYFSENFKYTLTPGATPDGEDFIDCFLTEQKEGYCTYFATAGVELLRMFGFPARYVEGYMVLPSQLDNNSKNGDLYKIKVQDRSAHAWAEIYLPSEGWIPVEFTPGYDNNNPNLVKEKKDPGLSSTADSSSSVAESSSAAETTTAATTSSKAETTSSKKDSSTHSNNNSSSQGRVIGKTNEDSSESSSAADSQAESPHSAESIIILISGIALILGFILIRRKSKLNKMKYACTSGNTSERVKSIFVYTLKYLELLGVSDNENITDMQLTEVLLKQCKQKSIVISAEDFTELCEIAVKAEMSQNDISTNEAEKAYEIMKDISENTVKKRLNKLQLISAKYLYCLY